MDKSAKEEILQAIYNEEQSDTTQTVGQTKKKNSSELEKFPLIRDKEDKIRKIRANLTRILSYYDDSLKDLFVYNEATHNIEIIEDRKIGIHTLKKGVFNDAATIQIASYISNTYYLDFQNNQIADEVEALALTKSYNPIKDFLNQALANKKNRDPFDIVRKYINIEDSEYNRIALDLFFRGAIARIFEPGCQFDYCLDLVGPQGGRKTTFLRQVFMDWYTDQIETFNKKDDLTLMVQSWLVNDEELEATNKITFGGLKKVITLSVISFRPPYGRSMRSQLIDFVFSRTTNVADHLGDATGDRRFLGIHVGKTSSRHQKKISDEDLRDIWGNYYASYVNNPKLYYDDDEPENQLIEQEREKFKKVDEITETLMWYLDQAIPADFFSTSTQDWQRRSFYSQLQSTGVAYKSKYNEDIEKEEWRADTNRDRVSINDVINELFYDRRMDKSIKRKVKLFFDNMPDWERKRVIKFGKRQTSGYIKRDG